MRKFLKPVLPLALVFSMTVGGNAFAAVVGNTANRDIYTVEPGDSLTIIANKFQVGLDEVIKQNAHYAANPNLIYPGDKVTVPPISAKVYEMEEEVISLVNKERALHGIAPLTINWELARVARYKSQDMRDKNYFSHTSPTYGSPFAMLNNFDVKYLTAGENIAKGQKSADDVVAAWMNSEGHRANILNPNFKEIGVGYCTGNSVPYWTQMFITARGA